MEQAILDIIEKRYKRKYCGGIKVTKLKSGYSVSFDLGIPDKKPITISADLEAEDFLKFVEQELISRQLYKVQFFRGIKRELEDETRRINCKNKQGY